MAREGSSLKREWMASVLGLNALLSSYLSCGIMTPDSPLYFCFSTMPLRIPRSLPNLVQSSWISILHKHQPKQTSFHDKLLCLCYFVTVEYGVGHIYLSGKIILVSCNSLYNISFCCVPLCFWPTQLPTRHPPFHLSFLLLSKLPCQFEHCKKVVCILKVSALAPRLQVSWRSFFLPPVVALDGSGQLWPIPMAFFFFYR